MSGRSRPVGGRSLVPIVIVPGTVVTLLSFVDVSPVVPVVPVLLRLPLARLLTGLLGVLPGLIALIPAFLVSLGLAFGPASWFVPSSLLLVGQSATGAFLRPDVGFVDVLRDFPATPRVVVATVVTSVPTLAVEMLPIGATHPLVSSAGFGRLLPTSVGFAVRPPTATATLRSPPLTIDPLLDWLTRSTGGLSTASLGRSGSRLPGSTARPLVRWRGPAPRPGLVTPAVDVQPRRLLPASAGPGRVPCSTWARFGAGELPSWLRLTCIAIGSFCPTALVRPTVRSVGFTAAFRLPRGFRFSSLRTPWFVTIVTARGLLSRSISDVFPRHVFPRCSPSYVASPRTAGPGMIGAGVRAPITARILVVTVLLLAAALVAWSGLSGLSAIRRSLASRTLLGARRSALVPPLRPRSGARFPTPSTRVLVSSLGPAGIRAIAVLERPRLLAFVVTCAPAVLEVCLPSGVGVEVV